MADLIEKGDIVDVYYVDSGTQYNCKVLHCPCDVGDMWYFEDSLGDVIAQNPISLNLDFIKKSVNKSCPHNVKTEDAHLNNPKCQKCEIQGRCCDFVPF